MPYDLSAYLHKLTSGTFFSSTSNRSDLNGIFRALKNLNPALAVISANLMFLERSPCPSGIIRNNPEVAEKFAEQFTTVAMEHPASKAVLISILKKMLLDTARHRVTTKAVLAGKKIYPFPTIMVNNNQFQMPSPQQLR